MWELVDGLLLGFHADVELLFASATLDGSGPDLYMYIQNACVERVSVRNAWVDEWGPCCKCTYIFV